jgi:hypothetical protein
MITTTGVYSHAAPSGLVTLTRPYPDRRSCYGLPLRQRVFASRCA